MTNSPSDRLDSFPRVPLCHRPTPLEAMPRLSRHLGGPQLFIKRDDCTGLAIGGNKTRKLEYLMGEAVAKGATTIITVGGVQSNHARQTAAAAARLGLACELILPRVVPSQSADYESSGNVLLDRLLGAKVHITDDAEQSQEVIKKIMASVEAEGGSVYFIPSGGSTPLGALGYVEAAFELDRQASAKELNIDYLVVASSTGGTQAGLLTGLTALGNRTEVIGVTVYNPAEMLVPGIKELAAGTSLLLEMDEHAAGKKVRVEEGYLGEGYGLPTKGMIEAVSLTATLEGVLLDPVYTGKAMAGLIDMIRAGQFEEQDNVVFLHTGGVPALFPYREALTQSD